MALLPVSISIGILCGLWMWIAASVPWLQAWIGYAAWASFYFSGGDRAATKLSIAANLAGMIQGAIFFWLWLQIGGGSLFLLGLFIGVFCFVMTMEGNIALLAKIPAQFVGAATYFGATALKAHDGVDMWSVLFKTAVIMIIGNLAGILSAEAPGWFQKKKA